MSNLRSGDETPDFLSKIIFRNPHQNHVFDPGGEVPRSSNIMDSIFVQSGKKNIEIGNIDNDKDRDEIRDKIIEKITMKK
ncbi:MAG: hypothetical protein ACLFPF_05590 [Halanaerobiales bacterium]